MATVAGTSAELEALSQEFNYLVNNIDISCLLPAALSSSLITQQQRLECVHEPNPFMKAQKFLGHLLGAVKGDSNKYHTFIQILHETGQASITTHLQDVLTHHRVTTSLLQSINIEGTPTHSPVQTKRQPYDSNMHVHQDVTTSLTKKDMQELQISSTSLFDEPKLDYSCPVCAGLLTEPFLTDCGHLVCGACRDRLLTTNKNDCPVCRETNGLSNARLDKRFQREVYSLKVHCQYHDEGCEWVGEVRDLQKHLDPERGNCSYVAAMMEQHQQTTLRQVQFQASHDLSSVTYKYKAELEELKSENEMLQAKFDKLGASHQLVQADLDVEKELQAKLIQAVQCSRPTRFLIMQLEDKLLTQQAASPLLDVSQQRGLDILNAIKPWSVATVETSAQTSSVDVTKDFLRGVEVYGETVLEVVGDKSQKLEWPGYGFYIEVPDGALPPGVTAHVAVKVMLAGQFELPEDSQLVSAIYWVSSSEVFLKEVDVNIQHCAAIMNEEQCSEFKFIVARCSQNVLPYKFKKKDGLFNMHTQYAAIKVKQFSLFGLTSPWNTELQYMSLKFYKPIANTNKVDYVFVLVRNHELYVKAVRQKYADFTEDEQMQSVEFASTEVILNLSFPDPETVDGWKIQPLTYPKLTKADVKQFWPSKPLIPACNIEVEWIGEGQQQQLFHKVTISGAKEPNVFYMRYYPRAAGDDMSTGATGVTPSPHHQSSTATSAPFIPQQLPTVAYLSSDEIETILRENYVELHGAMCVNPANMARKLYARGLITKNTLHTVTSIQTTATDETKADALMEESQRFILSHESSAEMLAKFLGIMDKAGGTAHNVAESILQCVIKGKGNETSEVPQPILSPDSMIAPESPSPSASYTNSEISASQQSIDSPQGQVQVLERNPLDKVPTLPDLLNRVASRARDKWDMVGLQLGIEEHQLSTISTEHQDAPIRCYSKVFSLWKNKADPPYTWRTIVGVLRAPIVEREDLAIEIETWLSPKTAN